MAYIRTVEPERARGLLQRLYEEARRRAGRIYNVIRIQSLHPRSMKASVDLYKALMLGPGPLPRPVREMLATVVSREMECFY